MTEPFSITEFEIRNLTFTYPERRMPALSSVSMTVQKGEFLVLLGPSGCGKSTLLRHLKTVLTPHGTRSGEILFEGKVLDTQDFRTQSARIGYVHQSPDDQIVTDKVWHELAFGAESLGFDPAYIRRRTAETASFFGIQTWFHKDVRELSGGQKQLLNLASAMISDPSVLILDEPTSQLDPIAASEFLSTLSKINRELGVTVILTEHRLEEALPLADRAVVMEGGHILCGGTPADIGEKLYRADSRIFASMPAAMRVWAGVGGKGPCPVTVRDGTGWLTARAKETPLLPLPELPVAEKEPSQESIVIEVDEAWFRYERDLPDTVKGLSFRQEKGSFTALLGGNGTGKTTTLKILSGVLKPYRGEVRVQGRVGMLPQNPQALFLKKTVREDLFSVFEACPVPDAETRTAKTVELCRLSALLDSHPYDLSGGEQQRAALAKLLLTDPDILLLDEPTKGLDAGYKRVLASMIADLKLAGKTILMVSHDVEFCAEYADRCAMFFDGAIVGEDIPRRFFSGNRYYTTAVNRMAHELLPTAVTAKDLIISCGGTYETTPVAPDIHPEPITESASLQRKKETLSPLRRIGVAITGTLSLLLLIPILRSMDISAGLDESNMLTGRAGSMLYAAWLIVILLFACFLSIPGKGNTAHISPVSKEKLSHRTILGAVMILLAVPLTLFFGVSVLGGTKYYFISLLVLFECMLPFFFIFESRKPQARELVVIASLCALGVAGRAVFFMLPQFKPVMAITILAGVAFGGESGFLVGAVTMLVSNVLFSQGPWTPWQMFSMGMIGFLAGILYGKGLIQKSRLSLAVFGAVSALVIYGGIMNPASALMWSQEISWKIILSYYITGFPMDCVHAIATFLFLWFGAEPILEKLDRIKIKYGLLA
ncbi:MAG: ATP-binding cassette domain-containing protein [Clostridia bacterium]|nr:ATP-binding cassette domain-containing protein [Clostridia bacterium]